MGYMKRWFAMAGVAAGLSVLYGFQQPFREYIAMEGGASEAGLRPTIRGPQNWCSAG